MASRISEQETLSVQDMIWALGSLCQVYRVPFSPELALQQFPPPHDRATLLTAAKAFDFDIGEKRIRPNETEFLALPCLAFTRPDPQTAGVAPDAVGRQLKPALLAHIDNG